MHPSAIVKVLLLTAIVKVLLLNGTNVNSLDGSRGRALLSPARSGQHWGVAVGGPHLANVHHTAIVKVRLLN